LEIVVNFLGFDIPDLEVDYAVLKDRVRQYVFISSATVYAKPHRALPITENGPFGNPWWITPRRNSLASGGCKKRQDGRFPDYDSAPIPHLFPAVDSKSGLEFQLHFREKV
jgi:hypothetical protein